jgi:MSHA biogenesis protein MshO
MKVYSKQTGFSLLELILVIVLLGILASGAGLLITTPIKAYNDQLRRTQLVDMAEMSLRQIARDIRTALPNSIRTNQNIATGVTALEMVNIVAGARYRDEADGPALVTAMESEERAEERDLRETDVLDFKKADTDFNFLGTLVSGMTTIPTGQRLVIYSTAPTNFYATASSNNNAGIVTPANSTLILSQDGDEQHLNITPAFQFTQEPPGQRSFLIDGPISYVCDPLKEAKMTRYTNYPFQPNQPTTDDDFIGLSGLKQGDVATQLTACSMTYDAGTAQRNGVVTLSITLSDDTGEGVTLLHQVHVVNVP